MHSKNISISKRFLVPIHTRYYTASNHLPASGLVV